MLSHFRLQVAAALAGGIALVVLLAAAAPRGSASPSAGDTYAEAAVGVPNYINPLLAASDTDRDLTHLIYSGLARVDESGKLVPDLAGGWQISPDARVFTFTLRPDLKWQDGRPLTADDVVFTIGLVKDKGYTANRDLALAWHDVEVAAPDAVTVRFTLPMSNGYFPQRATLGILPRHLWQSVKASELDTSDRNRAPVGSGPWRLVLPQADGGLAATNSAPPPTAGATPSAQAQEKLLLEPNPYSTRPAGSITRLWFRVYPTFGAALTALAQGEVHGLAHIPADRLAEVQALSGVTVHSQALARYAMLILNTRSPLLDRVETRRAISLALDSQAIAAQALGGQAVPASGPLLPHSGSAGSPAPSQAVSDPAEARALLSSAGWVPGPDGVRARDGVSLTLVLTANRDAPASVAVARMIEKQLGQVGIRVNLALVTRDRLIQDYLAPRAFHMVLAGWEAEGAYPDLSDLWHSGPGQPTTRDFSGWSNPQADEALDAARSSADPQTRSARLQAFAEAFMRDIPGIALYTPLFSYATREPASGVSLPETDLLSPVQRFDTIGKWTIAPHPSR